MTVKTLNNKTIPWVTLAKFIGLYLMILGHMGLVRPGLSAFIYTFHMPLFFILSGMFTSSNSDKKVVYEKIYRKLIIPFVIIAAIWCVIYILLWIKNGMFDFGHWMNNIVGTFVSPGKRFGVLETLRGPLWFLLALAEIKILAIYVKKEWLWIFLSVSAIVVSILLGQFNVVLPFAFDSAIFAVPFYTAGVFLRQYPSIWDTTKWKSFMVAIVCGLLTYVVYKFNGIVDINHCHWGNNILLFYIGGLLGSIGIFYFSISASSKKKHLGGPILTLVSGAMLIIGFSQNISSIVRSLLSFLAGSNIGGMLIGVITLVLLYPLIILSRKFFPAILGYRK